MFPGDGHQLFQHLKLFWYVEIYVKRDSVVGHSHSIIKYYVSVFQK